MEKIRIIFFGSGNFGLAILEHLFSNRNLEIALVVTAPDRQSGRGFSLRPDPVAEYCQKQEFPIFKPERLKIESLKTFTTSRFDLGIVASYGKIVPYELLGLPRAGFINVHPSLLPRYRGSSPISAALLDGATKTGVTLIQMDAGIDTGPIVAQKSIEIPPDIMRDDLERLLIKCSNELLDKTLIPYLRDEITILPQSDILDRPTKKIKKKSGLIDWSESAEIIYRKYQAFHPWPGIWTTWNSQIVKFIKIKKLSGRNGAQPGTVIIDNNRLIVSTATQDIEILCIQIPGKRIMAADEFINGHASINGVRLPC